MIALDAVNRLDRTGFVDTFGDIAEHSPWVADRAFDEAPFDSREAVIAAFDSAMRHASEDEQLELIRAHPDLAGKAALAGKIAEDSRKEQAGAGFDTLTAEEFAEFTAVNSRYREKFGFPFIFAVKGSTKHMILKAFAERIDNDRSTEFAVALNQISRIFRFRLEDRIGA